MFIIFICEKFDNVEDIYLSDFCYNALYYNN